MTITEESRHRLYQALEQAIGHEEATTLMEHLPPVGWADVATTRDLDHLRAEIGSLRSEMDLRLEALEHRLMGAIHQETKALHRTIITAIVGSNAVLATVALGAVALA